MVGLGGRQPDTGLVGCHPDIFPRTHHRVRLPISLAIRIGSQIQTGLLFRRIDLPAGKLRPDRFEKVVGGRAWAQVASLNGCLTRIIQRLAAGAAQKPNTLQAGIHGSEIAAGIVDPAALGQKSEEGGTGPLIC